MRIAFVLQNLQVVPRKPHGRARSNIAGKPSYQHYLLATMMAIERGRLADRKIRLEQVAAANAAFEERLAEARRQASMLKVSLYATILSEV